MRLWMTPPPRRFFLVPSGAALPPGADRIEDALGRTQAVDLAGLSTHEVDRAAVDAWSAAERAGVAVEAAAAHAASAGSPTPGSPDWAPAAQALMSTLGARLDEWAADPDRAASHFAAWWAQVGAGLTSDGVAGEAEAVEGLLALLRAQGLPEAADALAGLADQVPRGG